MFVVGQKVFLSNVLQFQPLMLLRLVCSQYNVDETACKSYVQHLEFLDAKAKKRVRESNTLPLISWTIEKDVKALTNKQLKMYLREKGLK